VEEGLVESTAAPTSCVPPIEDGNGDEEEEEDGEEERTSEEPWDGVFDSLMGVEVLLAVVDVAFVSSSEHPDVFVSLTSPFFHFILRFWNQILM